MEMIALFQKRHPEMISHVAPTDKGFIGYKERRLLSILNKKKLERVLALHARRERVSRAVRNPFSLAISPG